MANQQHPCRLIVFFFARPRRKYAAILLIALIASQPFVAVTLAQEPTVQYVTNFETRTGVAYQPRVQMTEQTIARPSWNPFRRTPTIIRKMVPAVTWVPITIPEKIPVTERVAIRPTQNAQANESQRIKNPRLAAATNWRQLSGANSIDQVPTRNFQTRSIGDFMSDYGGVQRLDNEMPRVGMRLLELR